jgi:hypothetical protein
MTAIGQERGVLSAASTATVAGMERTMWTDERLDDLSHRVDAGFDRVDSDIRELRGDIGSLRSVIMQVGVGLMIGMAGVIASILVSSH